MTAEGELYTGVGQQLDVRQRRDRERRVWRWAFVASVGFHLLLLLLGPLGSVPPPPYSAAGPDAGDDVAADGFIDVVALSSAPPDLPQPPPVPVPDVELPEPELISPDAEIELGDLDPPDPGQGETDGDDLEDESDAGMPDVEGAGADGTVAEGQARRVPPSPRGMIMPPTNQELRGRVVEVWVFVDIEGRVVADSTELRPPTSNRSLNEQLAREAAQWVFTPAREDGVPVASWFPYTIRMD